MICFREKPQKWPPIFLYQGFEIWYNYSMIIPLVLETTKKADRSCGSCTKCCDGWLTGTAYGHDFSPSKPCYFVTRQGCSIYPIRPESPCKTFRCHWKENTRLPDWLQPNKSGVIVLVRYLKGIRHLRLISASDRPAAEQVYAWADEYATAGTPIIAYTLGGIRLFSNNEEFTQAVNEEFGTTF